MSHWTLVSERLPSNGQRVLVCILNQYANAPWDFTLRSSYYSARAGKPDGYWACESSPGGSLFTPYAWMPWPEPPALPSAHAEHYATLRQVKRDKLTQAAENARRELEELDGTALIAAPARALLTVSGGCIKCS